MGTGVFFVVGYTLKLEIVSAKICFERLCMYRTSVNIFEKLRVLGA